MELDLHHLPFCGRQDALQTLEQALEGTLRTAVNCKQEASIIKDPPKKKKNELLISSSSPVLVVGASGTGKSELVQQFMETIKRNRIHNKIWCCRGKYDNARASAGCARRPFSAIADCFAQLVDHMLLEDEAHAPLSRSPSSSISADGNSTPSPILLPWSEKLQQDKQVDYSVLVPLIPNIAKLLQNTTKMPTIIEAETQALGEEVNATKFTEAKDSKTYEFELPKMHHRQDNTKLKLQTGSCSVGSLASSSVLSGGDDQPLNSFHGLDRYVVALRSLTKLVTSSTKEDEETKRSLVFVYEDLQWADSTSVRLHDRLFAAATADKTIPLLAIGTMRPLPDNHPFQSILKQQQLQKDTNSTTAAIFSTIELGAFDAPTVVELLQTLFQQRSDDDNDELASLAKLIVHKTGGNPCAVSDYLQHLYHYKYVHYCFQTYGWKWDLSRIELETSVSNDIVQAVLVKMKDSLRVNSNNHDAVSLRHILLHAALLGTSQFESRVLYHAMQYSGRPQDSNHKNDNSDEKGDNSGDFGSRSSNFEELQRILALGCQHGLFETTSSHSTIYSFSHDRVLEAALTLIPQDHEERENLMLGVGRQLWKLATTREEMDSLLFLDDKHNETNGHLPSPESTAMATSILGMALTKLNLLSAKTIATRFTDDERLELAKYNQVAADTALETVSFHQAVAFLEAGLRLLDLCNDASAAVTKKKWTDHYESTLSLSNSLAYAYFCTGDITKSDVIVNEIIENAKKTEDKLDAYRTKILSRWQNNQLELALQASISVVEQVASIRLPKRFLKVHLIYQAIKIKTVLSKITKEEILQLPQISDEKVLTALHFLNLFCVIASFANAGDLQMLAQIESIKLSLKHGYGPDSSLSIGYMGTLLSMLGDYDNGYRLSNAALELFSSNQYPVNEARAKFVMYAYSLHWKMPMQDCLGPLLDSSQTVTRKADVSFLFLGCFSYCLNYFYSGLDLRPLEEDYVKFDATLVDYGQHMFLAMFYCRLQQIRNLMGKASGHPTHLTGDAMNQDECIAEWKRTGHRRALFTLYLCRMELAYYFDCDELGQESYRPFAQKDLVYGCQEGRSFKGFFAFDLLARNE